MNKKLPEEVRTIINKFLEAGYKIYIVGGAVRDLLMGRKVSDWDFTTDAKPEEILKLFPEGFYDNKFGTVGIPTKNTSEVGFDSSEVEVYEVTTMRKEGKYADFRHPQYVGWTNKIEEDLARRDFTINAIALSVIASEDRDFAVRQWADKKSDRAKQSQNNDELVFIDPFRGQQDITDGVIRTVGDPNKRFQEDALRLIRAVRIATELNFDIEKETYSAIKINSKLLSKIAWERIRNELFKLLASTNRYKGKLK